MDELQIGGSSSAAPFPQPEVAETPAYDPFAWSDDIKKKWDSRIRAAREVQAKYHPWWEASLKNYAPRVDESPDAYSLRIRTNRAFVIVERKEADLFYQKPDVQVSPSPLLETIPNHQQMVAAHATIINAKLGLNGVNVKAMAQEAIFNYVVLGQGPTKVFYRAYMKDIEREVKGPDGLPVLDPMTQMPQMETQPVLIKSKCGWECFSPRQFLIPSDFRSKDFDENAPWLGRQFTMAVSDARAMWGEKIPADFQSSGTVNRDGTDKKQYFDIGGQQDAGKELAGETCTGTEIFFRSCLFRSDITHPDHLTQLVIIDGIDEPVEYKDSPDQTVISPEWIAEDPQTRTIFQNKVGDLTPDSIIGFPYETLIIRVLTDSAYVMGDVAVALPQTQELDKTRAQAVRQRDINLVKFAYDPTKFPTESLNKMISSDQGGIIEVPTEMMINLDQAFRTFDSAPIPSDNYRTFAGISSDLDQTFGIDAEAAGVSSGGDSTATEKNIQQANRNVRSGKEQSFVADWFIRGVTKFSTLIQRYMTVDQAAEIVGRDQAIAWDQWRKAIPTRLAFHIAPDSSMRNDTPLERMQLQQLFSYLANDPHVNRKYFLERLLTRFGLDPTRALIPDDQIPPPKKEDPKISFSFKGEDLSPLAPQSPIILEIMAKTGVQISPDALEKAKQLGIDAASAAMAKAALEGERPDTEHGGKLAPRESLDKHLSDLTGGQSQSGAMLPGMSGNVQ